MCGIAGFYGKNKKSIPENILNAFARSLRHRGPDDHDIYKAGQCALVHTRLSIIDLDGGHQPLLDAQENALVVNGEIYNYKELRAQFPKFSFRTQSDCEVILPLYEKHGIDFVKHLRGMYGVALYDPQKDRLILSRDPFGIKPLYYTKTKDGFAFASEMRSFVQAGLVDANISESAFYELMQLRFSCGAKTIFENIYRVMPGETLVIEQGQITQRFYIDPLDPIQSTAEKDDLDTVLNDSVAMHLRADVPCGLFLSGGVDSAILLKLMATHYGTNFQTFTVGFPGTGVHDERDHAATLAESIGTQHTQIDFTEDDFWEQLPHVAHAMDEPIFDQAMLPTFKLAQVASKDLKVVLCGEGGDEIFAGYRRYQKASRPWWLGGRISRAQKGIFDGCHHLFKGDVNHWRANLEEVIAQEKKQPFSKTQVSQAVDCKTWLPFNLLTKLDRCLMHFGVEGRTPFVDVNVAAYGFHLPDKEKMSKGYGKLMLRTWLKTHFPQSQPFAKKKGFNVPVNEWLKKKSHILAPLLARQDSLKQFMNPNELENFVTHMNGKTAYGVWEIFFYALWHKIHKHGVVHDRAIELLEA